MQEQEAMVFTVSQVRGFPSMLKYPRKAGTGYPSGVTKKMTFDGIMRRCDSSVRRVAAGAGTDEHRTRG